MQIKTGFFTNKDVVEPGCVCYDEKQSEERDSNLNRAYLFIKIQNYSEKVK